MPSETDDNQRAQSPIERMINALDEVKEAVDRLAAEKRTSTRPVVRDFVLLEPPFSRDDSSR
jgi:hypothetical protein